MRAALLITRLLLGVNAIPITAIISHDSSSDVLCRPIVINNKANSKDGKDNRKSIALIAIWSNHPPRYPLVMPIIVPRKIPKAVPITEIKTIDLAPAMTYLKHLDHYGQYQKSDLGTEIQIDGPNRILSEYKA